MYYRLIYISTATKREKLTGQIHDILNVAVNVNKSLGITGYLVEFDGTFIQVLEGPREKVLPLYFKIERDERHKDVILIEYRKVEARKFKRWSMASAILSDDERTELHAFKKTVEEQDFDALENLLLKLSDR